MNSAFFSTLGFYVYAYFDPDTNECLYVGKGVNDRCLHHVKEKGYEAKNCKIIACNLATDAAAKAIEALKINELNPRDNLVKGHHWENYVMADLSFLFKNYTDAQWNGTSAMVETLQQYPELMSSGKLNVEAKPSSYFLISPMIKSVYCIVKVQGEETTLMFEAKQGEKQLKEMEPNLNESFKEEIERGEMVAVTVDRKDRCGYGCSLETALDVLQQFLV